MRKLMNNSPLCAAALHLVSKPVAEALGFLETATRDNGVIFYDALQFRGVLQNSFSCSGSLSKGMITIDPLLQGQQLLLLRQSCVKASWENPARDLQFSLDIVEGCEHVARPKHCFTPQIVIFLFPG